MKDCIIEALANPEKERMKHDDTTISSWLQSKYFYFSKDEISFCCNRHAMYFITHAKSLVCQDFLRISSHSDFSIEGPSP